MRTEGVSAGVDKSGDDAVTDDQLTEQLRYYSSRAPEYDDWWLRRGRFDLGAERNAVWFAEAEEVRQALSSIDLGEHCLELAPGTGTWSVHLLPRAGDLTLVDGSLEMLSHNPVVSDARVRVEVADLFTWDTEDRFDSVVFAFWISHVPRERLDRFFARVARWLVPGGAVFFVDDAPSALEEPHVVGAPGDDPDQTMVRRLGDGTTATVVKNFYRPEHLVPLAARHGVGLTMRTTAHHFEYGTGTKAGADPR
jgi:SAM-dependent methyltransferase